MWWSKCVKKWSTFETCDHCIRWTVLRYTRVVYGFGCHGYVVTRVSAKRCVVRQEILRLVKTNPTETGEGVSAAPWLIAVFAKYILSKPNGVYVHTQHYPDSVYTPYVLGIHDWFLVQIRYILGTHSIYLTIHFRSSRQQTEYVLCVADVDVNLERSAKNVWYKIPTKRLLYPHTHSTDDLATTALSVATTLSQ